MNNGKVSKRKRINWIFAMIGVTLIVVGAVLLIKSENFKKNAVQAEATITDIDIYEDADGDNQYNVWVEFYADDAKIEGNLGYHVSGMKKRQTVKIFYNPDDPSNFKSASGDIWIFMVFIVLGIPFLFAGSFPVIIKLVRLIKDRRGRV